MPYSRDNDGAVFEQLRPRLKAISFRIVGSEAEAEDIVQDCFLKWHGADRTELATPAAWLTTVVQHQSIDRLRTTASSMNRAFLVEVMGRGCGYLALMAGIAGGAEAILVPEIDSNPEDLARELRAA